VTLESLLGALLGAVGVVLLLLGLAIATVGLYGLLRKRDLFAQLHAAGLVTGPGAILVLLASVGSGEAQIVTSAVLVIAFVLVTSSLSTHAIALAAWRRGDGAAGRFQAARMDQLGKGRVTLAEGAPGSMRLLIAVDGSPAAQVALRLAAALSLPPGASIRLVAVAEGELQPLASFEGGRQPTQSEEAELTALLETAAALLEGPGRSVDLVVRHGSPAEAIIREASEFRADLVVMGSRGLGRVRSLLVGSVAQGVLDGAPCPVLVARATTLRRVLVATDGTRSAEAAVDVVAQWPIFEGAHIDVVSVATEAPQYRRLPGAAGVREALQATRRRRVADRAALRLRDAGRNAVPRTESGAVVARLRAVAESESVDLIVLGSGARAGLRRVLLGSVARDLVATASVSVLVVPPADD
jgi:multicomponent Na+:H+ antiporter subunit G